MSPSSLSGLGPHGNDPTVISEYYHPSHQADSITDLANDLSDLAIDPVSRLTHILDQSQLRTTSNERIRAPPPVPGQNDAIVLNQPYVYPESLMPHLAWQLVYGRLTFPQAIVNLLRLQIHLQWDSVSHIQCRLCDWVAATSHVRSPAEQIALLHRASEPVDEASGFTLDEIFGYGPGTGVGMGTEAGEEAVEQEVEVVVGEVEEVKEEVAEQTGQDNEEDMEEEMVLAMCRPVFLHRSIMLGLM